MASNVGEMFYTGKVPWHGEGRSVPHPLVLSEAMKAGGLDWEVGTVDLMTDEIPPSPVPKRMAIVRTDRQPGNKGRVLGVAHREFEPLQNEDGARIFDDIFGQGKPVYHTGGWLGAGEKVWLMAEIDQDLEIAKGDIVKPYALFANSHDGSMAFCIRLTTVRVVCQNTLAMAMQEKKFGTFFRRAHQGTASVHAAAARAFFNHTLQEVNAVRETYVSMSKRMCDGDHFETILDSLLPYPQEPTTTDKTKVAFQLWEGRFDVIKKARKKITELRENGKGMDLPGSAGTYWGALNAIIEFEDHHREIKGSTISHTLLGGGMNLKVKAYNLIRQAISHSV